MARHFWIAGLVLLAACGGGSGSGATASTGDGRASHEEHDEHELLAELAVRRSGCVRCHGYDSSEPVRVEPMRGPSLADAAGWHGGDGGAAFLERHHGGSAAADLAAYVLSLSPPVQLQPAATTEAVIGRGERLFGELACGACHAPDDLARLADRTDHAHVTAFLLDPTQHRPGVVHDFGVDSGEAAALAAWLLREQVQDSGRVAVPGFAYQCFELQIEDGKPPELDGLVAVAEGIAPTIDIEPRSRDNHYALRFRASIDVPATGEWTLTVGSDDGSWLWVDGVRIVENGGLKPHRQRSGSVQLDGGLHDLELVFTQAGGGQSLEVFWKGPGVDQQLIPGERASADSMALLPPPPLAVAEPAAIARGRAAAAAKRCIACHEIEDAELAQAPAAARPWSALGSGVCPEDPAGAGLVEPAKAALARPLDDRARLQLLLRADNCTSCHLRDGAGGLPAAVQQHLVETEDLGNEGRLPPELTRVGYRLRQPWIERVLAEGHRARPYLRVRMPRVSRARAAEYAALFLSVDGGDADDREPEFSTAAVEAGARAAGIQGRNCITCHSFAGAPSLGAQGMDLAVQYERLRPAWFGEWLLHATTLRPGTRMPMYWPLASDEDRREVDAIRTWLALGAAAPIPEGLVPERGSLVLLPSDRPVLHGAFLDGLSARCIAVGTRERTHYAFDVEHGRLAWLWRGDFLDATGTWHGRAGQLVKPLGVDWVVLEDFAIPGNATRRVLGHRVDTDGYPVFRVRAVEAGCDYEDTTRPRLAASGSELTRTLRCTSGALKIEWPQQDGVELSVAGKPAPAASSLAAGEELEIVYRW